MSDICKAFFVILTTSMGIVSAADLSESPACPADWTYWDGYCYSKEKGVSQWSDALAFCQSVGGDLVTAHSRRQVYFLSRLALQPSNVLKNIWLGCRRAKGTKTWSCVDDKEIFQGWAHETPSINESLAASLVLNTQTLVTSDDHPASYHYTMCQKVAELSGKNLVTSFEVRRLTINFCLTGHVVRKAHAMTTVSCSTLCLIEGKCLSFNLLRDGTCEINRMDLTLTGQGALRRVTGCANFEPVYRL
ncbi:C-type lectin lectoxin-Lio2-like [Diadema antillarum]|uniref:C-type lectin lectoxin-Lio2-like n=1 Tax=Diadema antillarum TaxID=105358 RepID=UPI003A84ACB2